LPKFQICLEYRPEPDFAFAMRIEAKPDFAPEWNLVPDSSPAGWHAWGSLN